ncbi:MAG: ABC transporter permease [Bifidobacteriaceae bacterium]|jgi:ABC-2 type transport system permease protein|nr:ABC transporter permease [Bifidobacteriaceae bacterium]
MTCERTFATARRILRQLRHDRRSIGLIMAVPCVFLGLLAWIFQDRPAVIDGFGPLGLALFPALVMFLVTSVTTLRERTSGTLERLMTTPIGKGDFLFGYALAFALVAALQAIVLTAWAHWVCGMDVAGSLAGLGGVAVLDAVLGCSLGLTASSLARTEFQAVQMMPVILVPQLLLCGLVTPRGNMPTVLERVSDVLPLSYAVEATSDIASGAPWSQAWPDMALTAAFTVVVLGLGVLTLRRRTA